MENTFDLKRDTLMVLQQSFIRLLLMLLCSK